MTILKILLVDDSQAARYALRLRLQQLGAEVVTADSAEKALAMIATAAPDAVFLDSRLPGMNGLEALELLKADPTTAALPVVICSSSGGSRVEDMARRKGALALLRKDLADTQLRGLLERVAESRAAADPAQPPLTTPSPIPATPRTDSALQPAPTDGQGRGEWLERLVEQATAQVTDQVMEQAQQRVAALIADHAERLEQMHTARIPTDATPSPSEAQLHALVKRLVEQAVADLQGNLGGSDRVRRGSPRHLPLGAIFAGSAALVLGLLLIGH